MSTHRKRIERNVCKINNGPPVHVPTMIGGPGVALDGSVSEW